MSEFLWNYRFLYRDINDLLARNRMLETNFSASLSRRAAPALESCQFQEDGDMEATPEQVDAICTNIVVIATCWLSFQLVQPSAPVQRSRSDPGLPDGSSYPPLLDPWPSYQAQGAAALINWRANMPSPRRRPRPPLPRRRKASEIGLCLLRVQPALRPEYAEAARALGATMLWNRGWRWPSAAARSRADGDRYGGQRRWRTAARPSA